MTIREAVLEAMAEIAHERPGTTFAPIAADHSADEALAVVPLGAVPRTTHGVRAFFLDGLSRLCPAMVYRFDGEESIAVGPATAE